MLLPLSDGLRPWRFPIVNVALIASNFAVCAGVTAARHSRREAARDAYTSAARPIRSRRTATSTRRPGEPNGYNVLRYEPPDRLSATVRTWMGEAFAEAAARAWIRVAGGWRPERDTGV